MTDAVSGRKAVVTDAVSGLKAVMTDTGWPDGCSDCHSEWSDSC